MRPSFFHHLHPPTIPASQARFRYTLGAGGLALYLTIIVFFTGILLTFYYVPTPDSATQSIQQLAYLIPFGWLIRNLHFWSAQLLIIVSALHLLRVVFTGAYAPPRRFNYLLGLSLFVLCLFLDFTGYVLRWDEGVHWALVTGTHLVKSIPAIGPSLYKALIGGDYPGAATLVRFYAWHLFGLTFVFIGIIVWHIFRVRRDGGIAVPPSALRMDIARITRFELVRREILAILWATVVLIVISVFLPAPLAPPIENGITSVTESRAPWFFLWVQQLLKLGNPFLFGVLVPLGTLVLLALLPYLLPVTIPGELGRWFPRGNRLAALIVALLMVVITLLTLLALV
jgi:quinol-cytochrome oxidoreductase complex cytochrome b subunit